MRYDLRYCGIAAFAVWLLPAAVMAQDMFSVYYENDSRYLKPNGKTDRHYTSGVKLVYAAQPRWEWLEEFGKWGGGDSHQAETAAGFFLGQNIYTPDHPEDGSRRGGVERRFAGWLYGGMFVERRQGETLDHLSLDVGVIGPSSKADSTQQCVHNLLTSERSVG